MATIDSNIALGVKPLQVENPINQYAAMAQIQNAQNQNMAAQNQNALAQYQLSAAKRGDEKVNFLNKTFAENTDPITGKINYAGVHSAVAKGGFGSELPALVKTQQAEQKEAGAIKKQDIEIAGLEFKQKNEKANKAISDIAALNSPQDAIAGIDRHLANGDIDQAKADMLKAQIAQTPFPTWQKNTLMGILEAKDKLKAEHDIRMADIAGGNLTVNQGNLNLANQKFKFETNPEAQANMAKAKKGGELAATEEVSRVKDIQGARKVLETIGFNPISGEDKVRNLIKKSTGSYGGASVDFLGRVIGESTEGADAIGQLKTFETKIATDLLGGKLSAGISTSDREFIVAGLGQISDNTLPRDTREKAWSQVVDRMRSVGLMDLPSDAKPTPTPTNPTAPAPSSTKKPSLDDIFKPKPKP
jgi:hypothetical protein